MKKLSLILLILFISTHIFSQTKECNCSGPLSKDLKTYFTDKEYSDFKDWLYDFYQKDETTRNSLKSNASSSWGAKFSAVIKAIPVGAEGNSNSSSSKDSQKYYRMEQAYLKNRYITNEEINELLVEEFSETQLSGYIACLKTCETLLSNGIWGYVGGDLSDILYVQIKYKAQQTGNKITLNGNASFPNLEPIGSLVFKDGLEIIDKQTITQYFKRLDPSKSASFSFNIKEGQETIQPIVLNPKPPINQAAIPIGTIVASVLEYKAFLKANGLDKMENEKMESVLWIPCDGRKENKSIYSSYSGGNIPDLRGVFLRGINDYNVIFPSVTPVKPEQKNPDNKVAGEFQPDGIRKHTHKYQVGNAVNGHNYNTTGGEFFHPTVRMRTTEINDDAQDETRPKNITVYYYIKIN